MLKILLKYGWLFCILIICSIGLAINSFDDRRQLQKIDTEEQMVSLVYSPDGQLIATGSRSGFIVLWDAQTGQQLQRWKAHSDKVVDLAFHPSGDQLLSSGADQGLWRWDIVAMEAISQPDPNILKTYPKVDARFQDNIFQRVAWSEDGSWIVAASSDGRLFIFDAESGELINVIQAFLSTDYYEGFSTLLVDRSAGVVISSGYFQKTTTLKIWDVASGDLVFQTKETKEFLPRLGGPIPDKGRVRYNHTTKRLVWIDGYATTLRTWDLINQQETSLPLGIQIYAPSSQSGFIRTNWYVGANQQVSLALTSDATIVAIGGGILNPEAAYFASNDNVIRLLRIGEKEPFLRLKGHEDTVIALSFSPDKQQLASLSWDHTLRIWDIQP